MSDLIDRPANQSSAAVEGFTRVVRWASRLWGVDFRVGVAVSTLLSEGPEEDASLLPRVLGPGREMRLPRQAEARALSAWEWEGGRTDLMEVPR